MKIHGQKVPEITPVIVPIIRGEDSIILKVKPTDWARFEVVCPEPTPPSVVRAGSKEATKDFSDPKYLAAKQKYSEKRYAWMFVSSLSATDNLTWEKVDVNVPDTWIEWQSELLGDGFLQAEINRIISAVYVVNQLDDDKIEQARKSFLAGSHPKVES
jgi:hypothetical protein